MKTAERIKQIVGILERVRNDPLKRFVAQVEADELPVLREELLKKLFEECRRYDIRYLYLGKGEICGCEGKRAKGGLRDGWPAMWSVADDLGINGGCGNSDQYQTSDYNAILFPLEAYGGWDLKKNVKLTDAEVEAKKFARVVTRDRSKDRW